MTLADAIGGLMVLLALIGALFAGWRYVASGDERVRREAAAQIADARREATIASAGAVARADSVAREVVAHRQHVAEEYVSRGLLREALVPITDGLRDVKGTLDNISHRIDRVIEGRSREP